MWFIPFFNIDQTNVKSQKLGFYDKIVTRHNYGEILDGNVFRTISKGFKLV